MSDMKSWPGGKGHGKGSSPDWQAAIQAYRFTNEQQMMDFPGNPIDILAPIAAAHISIVLIVKQGCDHHPHGLADPAPVVNFVLAHTASGSAAGPALPHNGLPGRGSVVTFSRHRMSNGLPLS